MSRLEEVLELRKQIQKQYLEDALNEATYNLDNSYVKKEHYNGYVANYLLNKGFCFEEELLKSFVDEFKKKIPLKASYHESINSILEIVHDSLDDYLVEFLEQENK